LAKDNESLIDTKKDTEKPEHVVDERPFSANPVNEDAQPSTLTPTKQPRFRQWALSELQLLVQLTGGRDIRKINNWSEISACIEGRSGFECRQKYLHLQPNIKVGAWTKLEDVLVTVGQAIYGSKFAEISALF